MSRTALGLSVAGVDAAAPVAAAVVVGTAYALHDRFVFRPLAFALILVGSVFAVIGTVALEAVFDHLEGADLPPGHAGIGIEPRALGEGDVAFRHAVVVGLSCLGVAALCGTALVPRAGSGIVVLGALGVGLGVLYSAPPIALRRVALGSAEAVVFVGAGLLPVLAGYYAQTSRLSIGSTVAAVPIGVWASAMVWSGHLARAPRDEALERPSPVTVWGEDRWRSGLWLWIAAGFAAAIGAVLSGDYPAICLVATAAFAWPAWALVRGRRFELVAAARLARATTRAAAGAALLVALGLVLSAFGLAE